VLLSLAGMRSLLKGLEIWLWICRYVKSN
jgi:hypothetical protein